MLTGEGKKLSRSPTLQAIQNFQIEDQLDAELPGLGDEYMIKYSCVCRDVCLGAAVLLGIGNMEFFNGSVSCYKNGKLHAQ